MNNPRNFMPAMAAFFLCLFLSVVGARAEVLIVADEFPAMRVVADRLKVDEKIESRLIDQKDLPGSLKEFQAVIVYIHKALSPKAENAFIQYAKEGGRLVVLHHSISSGKRTNETWFPFLGVKLPTGDFSAGGYKYIEGIAMELVNLNANHFITTHGVTYPARIAYQTTNAVSQGGSLPGFALKDTEVYLNHVHTEPHTLLMGIKYTDAKSGKTYMQDTAGWVKPAGRGWVVYLMAGHRKEDFEDPAYGKIVVNAVVWQP